MLFVIAQAAETIEAAPASGLAALGLDWRALLFQVLNFGILLWLLKRFAYQPIIQILQERRQKIEEGLTTAEVMVTERQQLAEQKRMVLARVQTEAAALLKASHEKAHKLLAESEHQARVQQQQTLAETEAKISQRMAQAQRELRQELASLVAQAVEQIIDLKLDEGKDRELIESRINQLLAQRS